jgi:DNA-binding SARP family transcriptional activator/pimeloyl-ACP methyl ester carboxylesterase
VSRSAEGCVGAREPARVVAGAILELMIRVRLFGSFEVDVDGRRLGSRDFGGVKPKQLLELLVLRRGRPVSKDELTDALWPTSPPRDPTATLESYASVVRSRLGSARGLLATETGGYRFDSDRACVDVDEFDAKVRDAAGSPAGARRARLEQALALASGDVLSDEPYAPWALDLRGVYYERRVQAVCDLAGVCLALGDFASARRHAEQALLLDPVLERAHRMAILAHYALGDEERALRAYERCRGALVEALGASPTPETAALHAAVLQREDPRALIPELAGAGSGLPDAPEGSTATRYAHNGEISLAYQTLGEGSPDLVFMPGFVSHVEAAWEDPTYSGFMRRLARNSRLIIFDKRGTGLSDAVVEWPSLEERVDDLLAVMDAAGSERAVLFGVSEGAPLCAFAAARHPELVAGLIMHSGFSRLIITPDHPHGWATPEFYELYLDSFERAWTTGEGLEIINPSLAGDRRYIRWYARYLRLSASPGMTRRLMRMNAEIDIDDALRQISVPTLITHRRDEKWVSPRNGRHLAACIPGARLVELPGADHHPWIGDVEPVHRAIDQFVAGLT